ncbi:MAG: hypothetical protein ACLFSQ_02230 [Candidatus Zixiibacteriota bacterium]
MDIEKLIERIVDLKEDISALKQIEKEILKKYSFGNIHYSLLFDAFLSDPVEYFSRKVGLEKNTSLPKLTKAIKNDTNKQRILSTSISSQLRNLYEAWVFGGILKNLASSIIEPRDLFGTLKLNGITSSSSASIIAGIESKNKLAIFLDTPLPPKDYVSGEKYRSRPDLGIYLVKSFEGAQRDKFSPTSNYLQLIALIECKESTVWPWTKKKIINPLNPIPEKIEVSHLEMLMYYEKLYTPPLFFLLSRVQTPKKALNTIKETNIRFFDSIGYNETVLEKVSDEIRSIVNNKNAL